MIVRSENARKIESIFFNVKTIKFMKKTRRFLSWSKNPPTLKILRIMRLTMIILFSTAMLLSAGTYSQNTKLTLDFTDISYGDLFSKIEAQSEFSFAYNGSNFDPNQKVRVNVANGTIKEILDKILPDDVSYEIINKYVIIRNADESNSSVSQQQKSISGRVTDSSGSPLPGVTVVIKGKTTGTITDVNGNFSLPSVPSDAKLAFSFVGMKPVEVAVAGKSVINVTMTEETTAIDEVVAIGYGTVKKKDLSGAVGVVKTGQLDGQINTNLGNALQGKIAGLTISSADGQPGGGVKLNLRGIGSVNSSNDPLVVVDGVPVASSTLDVYNGRTTKHSYHDAFSNLNPNDIESIQVLKDASAAAIYGTRAANGVILVTTKSGKKGAIKIDASADYGTQQIAKKLGVLTSDEWVKVTTETYTAGNKPVPYLALHPQVTGKGTNWQDLVYRVAPMQNYTVGATGGSENLSYNASLGYVTQDGIVKNTGHNRLILRLKSDFTKGRFKIGESVSIAKEGSERLSPFGNEGNNIVGAALTANPAIQVYNPANIGGYQGTVQDISSSNPLAFINLRKNTSDWVRIVANLYGEVTLMDGFTFKSSLSATNENVGGEYRSQAMDLGDYYSKVLYNNVSDMSQTGRLWQIENTLSYVKAIGKHSINAVIGQSALRNQTKNFTAYKEGLPDGIWEIDAATGTSRVTGNLHANTLDSYLGRLIYSYDNRYIFTGTIRRDGSSRFGKANPYATFPSLSLAWNVANENFFKNLATPVSELKVRGSWGKLGNEAIGDYVYIAGINSGYNYAYGNVSWPGASSTLPVSKDLKWESTETSNIGLDLGLWNGKLTYTVDVFQKKTTDMLMKMSIPGTAGYGYTGWGNQPYVNAGLVTNNGFEMTLNYSGGKGDFKYSVTGTLSHVKNKLDELLTGDEIWGFSPTYNIPGYAMNSFWLIKTDGLFRSQAEIDNYTHTADDGTVSKIQPNAKVGDRKWVDANGDGKISGGFNLPNSDGDRVLCGSPYPDFEYGLRLEGSWKSFDAAMFFQGVQGNEIYNGFHGLRDGINSYSFNTNSDIPRLEYNNPNSSGGADDYNLEDGSYLRLKTVQVGFTLPESTLKKLAISRCRIYVGGDNLITWTKYTGYDPGVAGANTDQTAGFDQGTYPISRVYHIGLQLNF